MPNTTTISSDGDRSGIAVDERIVNIAPSFGLARLALPKLKVLLEIGCPDGARVLALGRFMFVVSAKRPIAPSTRQPGGV